MIVIRFGEFEYPVPVNIRIVLAAGIMNVYRNVLSAVRNDSAKQHAEGQEQLGYRGVINLGHNAADTYVVIGIRL
jgi:hypothetical protein